VKQTHRALFSESRLDRSTEPFIPILDTLSRSGNSVLSRNTNLLLRKPLTYRRATNDGGTMSNRVFENFLKSKDLTMALQERSPIRRQTTTTDMGSTLTSPKYMVKKIEEGDVTVREKP